MFIHKTIFLVVLIRVYESLKYEIVVRRTVKTVESALQLYKMSSQPRALRTGIVLHVYIS